MEDAQIIELYFARDEQAIVETDRKYGGYCYSVANHILGSPEDSEETVSDTLLHTWNAIPPRKPDVFKMFLAKVTRNIAFTRWRNINAAKRGGKEMELVLEELEYCIPASGNVDDHINAEELAKRIREFLDTLPIREQNIFLRRYFFLEESEVIAAHYGMKRSNVLRTLSRTRVKLKTYLTQEGYTV